VSQRSKSSGRKFRYYYCDEEGYLKRIVQRERKIKRMRNHP
jgi:hypothetical protein